MYVTWLGYTLVGLVRPKIALKLTLGYVGNVIIGDFEVQIFGNGMRRMVGSKF